MLIIAVPKTALPALASDGFQCHVDGDPVLLRAVQDEAYGWLCYRDACGFDHRCKVLMVTDGGDRVTFYAASHGTEGEPHSVIAIGEDGRPVDLLEKE
jgi:hypothetical protein